MTQSLKTVRVFISSTFRDMRAERDHLVKVVFPELRERMAKRNLSLVDVDLRWGVTEEEAEHGKVLEVCFNEIERCRPFFIGILGERYGFVPSKVPEDIEFTHPWLIEYREHSLTALEIIHGVLRNPELAQRAFFYFRDPQVIVKVPENKRVDYTAESPEAARKLAALKDKIRASGRPVMEGYPCRWDHKQGQLVGLDTFGQRVLEDMWAAICAAYPEEALEADPLSVERQMHEAFAEERSRLHVGREDQARRLTEYVQSGERRPVVITGESGCGKSAFLANWHRKYATEHPDDSVLAYFIGASPDSANHFRLLRNMCLELKRRFSLKQEIPKDDKKLSETLAVLLAQASQHKERVVIVIDALDQLMLLEEAHGLGWLLDYMLEKARLVVSTLEGDCLDVLRRRGAEGIALPPLIESEQRQIVHVLLGEWRRKLDERQMTSLLSHPSAKNPLYLRVALEELRLFGRFEQLTQRIKALAEDIPRLFDQVLARLEEDHGRDLVTEAFSLLGCSRYGLSESEILELLRREGEEQFPRVLWARIYRISKMYLVQRGELITFFHRQLVQAVAARYPEHKKTHAKLAGYFEKAPLERKLDEYPYQLQQAEDWDNLAKALSDLDFFEYAWNRDRKYEWMGYWRSLGGQVDPVASYQTAIEVRIRTHGDTPEVAELLHKIGWFLTDMGLLQSALKFLDHSLVIIEHTVGPDKPEAASVLSDMVRLLHYLGAYEQSLSMLKRALAIDERTLAPGHPHIATDLSNLAAIYIELGKYGKALPLVKKALSIRERALGPDHPEFAADINIMAELYHTQGKYDKALLLHKRALAIKERSLGLNHPNVALSLNNIGILYANMGNYDEALPFVKRSLSIRERSLGLEHPDVALNLSGLAEIYRICGNYDEALPLHMRALSIQEKTLGQDHPLAATSLNNIAVLYMQQEKFDESLDFHKRALEIRENVFGPDHPEVANSLNNIGFLYEQQNKLREAMPFYNRAVKIAKSTLGANHPNTRMYMENLKACAKAMRKR